MQGLTDKVVIITGASEGIGRALAKAMAPLGCKLVLTARNQARLDSLVQELAQMSHHTPLVISADISSPDSCQHIVDSAISHFGYLDIVVNNAGMTMWSRFDELEDLTILAKLMTVNYLGPAYLTHSALPHLKASQGQVVVVSSVAGLTGVPTRSGYSASKHAVMGFFDSLRIELADDNVAVTVICPDFVVSEIHKRALDGQGTPLGRSPMQESKIISAEQCAQMMLPAIAQRQRMMITSIRGRLGRWLRLLAPKLIDNIAKKAIAAGH
ncbi:SDR family oxidoreductase [Shewanella algidipiscicola]|uniref:Short chain dehydrogenase n=1 Tax=Shewanella algidipiscicola TaxID=614070 RepID=A0ABQ4PGU1_9GAMM|nr:SDR family oxidoreductase [Shewanella algidipiscicola]GIU46780.1 short chain dehydrogenase [Shewanella algidipiscicola]